MTRSQSLAYRLRWAMLLVAALCFAAGAWWMIGAPPLEGMGAWGTPAILPFLVEQFPDRWGLVANGLLYMGLFLLTQWFFLFPHGRIDLHLTDAGRPLLRSVVIASLLAMMLTAGLITSVLELGGWWESLVEREEVLFLGLLPALVVLWGLWGVIFFFYWRGRDRYTMMTRLVRGLIAGSILELLVAAPAHALSEEDCYCARGSYTGLVFGLTVLIWAFGPGIVFLFLREQYRRQRLIADAEDDEQPL